MIDPDLLDEIEEFLDDHADIRDGNFGEPTPNWAMSLLNRLRDERSADDTRKG